MKRKMLEFKQHALTAISYLIPIVVSAGFCLAIGALIGGKEIINAQVGFTLPDVFFTMGLLVLKILPVVIATGIAFSIADKPGIAPGFMVGLIAININAGFIGGFIGGYLAGYVASYLVNNTKVPKWAEGLKPVLIIPLLSSIIVGLIMYYVAGKPISIFMDWLSHYLSTLDTSQKILYGAILGIFSAIDYGGPINKTTVIFLIGMGANGHEGLAILIMASMVTPWGMTIAYFLQKLFKKNIFTKNEIETLKTAFPMGVCQITEGSFPIIFNDLIKCLIATAAGSAIGGAICMWFGSSTPAPAGGLFSMITMINPWGWLLSLIIGSLVTAIVIIILKQNVAENFEHIEKEEEEIDLDKIKIS